MRTPILIRQIFLVVNNMRVVVAELPEGYKNHYPFKDGDHFLMLGEIENMPGHCAVVDKSGRILWAYHTENFREPTEEEL